MRVNSGCCSTEYSGWHRVSVPVVDHPLSFSCQQRVNLHWQTDTEELATSNNFGGSKLKNLAAEPKTSEEDKLGMVSRMLVLVCLVHFRGWKQGSRAQN